ncbi:Hpt domain-containing protein [Rhodospirillaceae bacterium SYSU D60014]|uniref:Hpt domain-containing protein n=1 Tax=Virgifigura deserti TaxID=2268457 RepID=UPI000E667F57
MTAPPYNPAAHGAAAGSEGERSWAETLARAEAAVAELAANYAEVALKDIADAQAALDAAKAKPEQRQDHIQHLYGIAHNVKGQGGSFGYPLVTRIGQSLCQLIKQSAAIRDADLPIIQAHLDALRLILERQVKGDGSETANKLAARLETLVGRDS